MKKHSVYKEQIEGLSEVQATVKVVEKAAASHIHFLKKKVAVLTEYKKEVRMVLERIFEFERGGDHPLLNFRKTGKRALLVIGGDKGIVGGLYHNIINTFLEHKKHYQTVWALGSRMNEYLSEEGIAVNQLLYTIADMPETEVIETISAHFFNLFQNYPLQSIDILYPKFISLVEQRPVFMRFLPFDFVKDNPFDSTPKNSTVRILENGGGIPIFEPSKKHIYDMLLKDYIKVHFVQIILETKLSELSARTVTAEHAVSKTQDIMQNLHLAFLKERRKSITQRQLENFIGHQTI